MNRSVFFVILCSIFLAGCKTAPINFSAMAPASQADLDSLQGQVDKDREQFTQSFKNVKQDMDAANLSTNHLNESINVLDQEVAAAKTRPASGGIPGALINTIANSGLLPPWLDWAVTLLGSAFGLNVYRNKTRAKALAKAKTQ